MLESTIGQAKRSSGMKRHSLHFFPAVIVLTVLLAYWPGLHGQFIFDDYPNIVLDNSLFINTLAPSELWSIFNGGVAGPFGRGLARLSFALNYYWAGLDPFAFKSTNLVIHLLNGYLIYLLARACLMTVGRASIVDADGLPDRKVALFISAVWLIHPIQLLPVLHVVQRMTSLAAFFVFLSMLLYIKGRMAVGRKSILLLLLAWLVIWPLGIFSKETALLFPIFVILWELVLNRARVDRLDGIARFLVVIFGCVGGGLLWYLFSPPGAWLWSGYQFRDFTPLERVLTEARVMWIYVHQIFLPEYEAFGLYHDDLVLSRSLWDPPVTALALLSLSAIFLLSLIFIRKFPLFVFGVLWFMAGHLLESSVFPLELMHEHRNYLPSFGLFLATASLLVDARLPRERQGVFLILAGAFLGYCIFLTTLRSHQFGNELRRSQIEAQHHRQSPAAHIDAGRVLANSDDARDSSNPAYSLAIRHFELSAELDPKSKMGLMGMIGLSCMSQVPPNTAWIDSLATRLHDTPFAPGDQNVLYFLKEVAIEQTNCLSPDLVSALFSAAATNESAQNGVVAAIKSWEADYYWLGLKNLPLARASLNQALLIAPAHHGMRLKKIQLDYLAGDLDAARREMVLLESEGVMGDDKRVFDGLVPLIF